MALYLPEGSEFKETRFVLIAGRLAVDFVNTAPITHGAGDGLSTWGGLVEFLVATGGVSKGRAAALRDLESEAPVETSALLRLATQLRTGIREILETRISGGLIPDGAVATINHILACTEGYERLVRVEDAAAGQSDWRLSLWSRSQGLEWLIASIARSAAELVAEGPGAPMRICANPKCGLFFYDASRTGGRKWCSMATCGNRAKVASHFRRRRK